MVQAQACEFTKLYEANSIAQSYIKRSVKITNLQRRSPARTRINDELYVGLADVSGQVFLAVRRASILAVDIRPCLSRRISTIYAPGTSHWGGSKRSARSPPCPGDVGFEPPRRWF